MAKRTAAERAAYRRGWAASGTEAGARRFDAGTASTAWEAGYTDYAAEHDFGCWLGEPCAVPVH